jgi:hypothetical protein
VFIQVRSLQEGNFEAPESTSSSMEGYLAGRCEHLRSLLTSPIEGALRSDKYRHEVAVGARRTSVSKLVRSDAFIVHLYGNHARHRIPDEDSLAVFGRRHTGLAREIRRLTWRDFSGAPSAKRRLPRSPSAATCSTREPVSR